MKEITSRALNLAQLEGARYADIRIINSRQQMASVKDGHVDGIGDRDSQGFGVRVLVGNSWGFASSAYLSGVEIDRVTKLAVKIARASATVPGEPVDLGPPVSGAGQYATPIQTDPFTIPLQRTNTAQQRRKSRRGQRHIRAASEGLCEYGKCLSRANNL
jgi:TldD protein